MAEEKEIERKEKFTEGENLYIEDSKKGMKIDLKSIEPGSTALYC